MAKLENILLNNDTMLIGFAVVFGILFSFLFLRYVVFAGIAYLVVWKLGKDRWAHLRIQENKKPNRRILKQEFLYSLLTFTIFPLMAMAVIVMNHNGIGNMYFDFDAYPVWYFPLSVVLMLVIHDTYFYFMHRAIHHPFLYKHVHSRHHQSVDPSPWASFAFHPLEAVLEALIFPIIVLIMPVHAYAVGIFFLTMMTMNVIGHMGYEFFPKWMLKNPITRIMNTATHHNMHHKFGQGNYGLYFNFWDSVMKTNFETYKATFDEVKNRKPNAKVDEKNGSLTDAA